MSRIAGVASRALLGVAALGLVAGCSSSHTAARPVPAVAAPPAGYQVVYATATDAQTLQIRGDAMPYAVPAGHTTGEYRGMEVVEARPYQPYIWTGSQLLALTPLCAIDGALGPDNGGGC